MFAASPCRVCEYLDAVPHKHLAQFVQRDKDYAEAERYEVVLDGYLPRIKDAVEKRHIDDNDKHHDRRGLAGKLPQVAVRPEDRQRLEERQIVSTRDEHVAKRLDHHKRGERYRLAGILKVVEFSDCFIHVAVFPVVVR